MLKKGEREVGKEREWKGGKKKAGRKGRERRRREEETERKASWARKMAQWGKELAVEFEGLSSTSGMHTVKERSPTSGPLTSTLLNPIIPLDK